MANSTFKKINKIDMSILRFINRQISNKTLNLLLPPLTNKYKFHYLVEILGIYLYSKFTKNPKKFKSTMLTFSEVFIATVLIKFIMKHKRPFVNYKDIIERDGNSPNVGAEEFRLDNELIKSKRKSWYSFPSTEAATSIVLLKLFSKPGINLYNVFLTSYFALILFSRMYNGMHRPVDILFGGLLGWLWPNSRLKGRI